jgi:hypothetical protein
MIHCVWYNKYTQSEALLVDRSFLFMLDFEDTVQVISFSVALSVFSIYPLL